MDLATIEHLCNLSKLNYTQSELARVAQEMDSIIQLMDTIKEIDFTYDDQNDDNSIYFSDLREDASTPSMETAKLLQNAQSSDGFFVVPKVIE